MKKFLIANWKMNGDSLFVENFINLLEKMDFKKINSNTLILCPPFTYIANLTSTSLAKKGTIFVGAQNFTNCATNSCTGGIKIDMLKDLGCSYVILGHSETRKFFSEDYECVIEKALLASMNNITPIICFEELDHISPYEKKLKKITNLILAYEPINAIGTGVALDTIKIKDQINVAKKIFNAKCIYGGSVNVKNTKEILSVCDGVLIGKASLDTVSFCNIIDKAVFV